jgi:hypothetical protein
MSLGSGIGTIDQLEPSQRSLNGLQTVSTTPSVPTAMHQRALVHDSPLNWDVYSAVWDAGGVGFGGAITDQPLALQRSATTTVPPKEVGVASPPTAKQPPPRGHDTALSSAEKEGFLTGAGGAAAVHVIARATPGAPVRTTAAQIVIRAARMRARTNGRPANAMWPWRNAASMTGRPIVFMDPAIIPFSSLPLKEG